MTDLENFLTDALTILIERATEARDRSQGAGIGAQNKDFEDGRFQAYYEVLTYILHLAKLFGVSASAVPAVDFDTDREMFSGP